VLADGVDLTRRQPGIDVHRPRIEPRRSENQRDLRRAVLADDHHPVARTHREALQQRRAFIDRLGQSAP